MMLLQIKNFRFWMKAKLGQRGAALVEYAVLLAFVAVIAAAFLTEGSLADSIKGIITRIETILSGAEEKANGTTGGAGSTGGTNGGSEG